MRFFSRQQDREAELIARKSRYASQLVRLFDFYLEQGVGKRFTQHYMKNDAAVREKLDMVGLRLVASVQKTRMISMEEIVDIVADVRPDIRLYYCSPEQQYQSRGSVVFGEFGKK